MPRRVLSVTAPNHPRESAHLIPHPVRIYAKSTLFKLLKYYLCQNINTIHIKLI